MTTVLPGDIVLKYKPNYPGEWYLFWKYLIQRAICFFTTSWWASENTSKVCHAEMVYRQIDDETFTVIDEEPPAVQFKTRSFNRRIIFRLKNKPPGFDKMFEVYVKKTLGRKYDYLKILLFVLDWIFHTNWFTKRWDLHHYFVCSEYVANFYQMIGHQCSGVDFESSDPDELYDYCKANTKEFELVSDRWQQ